MVTKYWSGNRDNYRIEIAFHNFRVEMFRLCTIHRLRTEGIHWTNPLFRSRIIRILYFIEQRLISLMQQVEIGDHLTQIAILFRSYYLFVENVVPIMHELPSKHIDDIRKVTTWKSVLFVDGKYQFDSLNGDWKWRTKRAISKINATMIINNSTVS